MGLEIERKFLVKDDSWRRGREGLLFRQGYLCLDPDRTLRIRIAGERAFLTIKGKTSGISRSEYEYSLPPEDARELLETLCLRPIIEKYRYRIPYAGHVWEVDEFLGIYQGLVLAEVELQSEEEKVELPPWVGQEVSGDSRYYNSALVRAKKPPAKPEES